MKRFFITLTRQVTIQARFDVEAETIKEARAKALELASLDNPRDDNRHGIEWESNRIQWLDATDPDVARMVALD